MADRIVRAVLTGSSAGAVKAFEDVALASEKSGKRMSAATAEHSAKIEGTIKDAGNKVKDFASGLFIGEVALTGAVGVAAKVFGDYQAAMAKLNTSMADAGQKWTPQLREEFDKTSDALLKVGFGTTETADAMAKFVTAGIPAKDALGDLSTAADLARFKNVSLSDATEMLVKATQGSSKALKDLGITQGPVVTKATQMEAAQKAVADAQAKLSVATQGVTVDQGKLALQQGALKIAQENYTLAVQKHGAASLQAQQAALKVQSAEDALANTQAGGSAKVKAAQDALAKAQENLKAKTDDYNVTAKHGAEIMAEVAPKVKDQADAYSHTLPGALAILKANVEDKLLIPMGQKLLPLFNQLSDWISQHSGDISNVLTGAVNGLGLALTGVQKALDLVKASIDFVKDHINLILPPLAAVTAAFVAWKVALGIQALIAGVTFALGFLTLGAWGSAAGGAAAATAFWALDAALGVLLSPVGLVVAAIAVLVGLAVLVVENWGPISGFFGGLWGDIKDVTGEAVAFIVDKFADLLSAAGWLTGKLSFLPGLGGLSSDINAGVNALHQLAASMTAPSITSSGIASVGTSSLKTAKMAEGGITTMEGLVHIHPQEAVIPLSRLGSVAGGNTINVYVSGADPNAVVNAIKQWQRSNGSLPVTVNAARRLGAA